MEVEIISKEAIKPSSPTPHYLKIYKLSLLDQLMPSSHVPMMFFYKPMNQNSNISQKLDLLKQSLSHTLTSFYPFAGKIKDDLYIDCNDDGVHYTEAKVNSSIADVLTKRNDIQFIRRLLPPHHSSLLNEGIYVAMIQVNVFNCGGIAIGTLTSHKIIDGTTASTFLRAWASIARGSGELANPSFVAPSLFPQTHLIPRDSMLFIWPSLIKFGKCVTKRYVFNSSAIATLQAKSSSASCVLYPTRVETVSAFLWRCLMKGSKARNGIQRPSVLSHTVNLRGKKGSPLSLNSIGNLIWIATAECKAETQMEMKSLVGILRNSITKIDGNLVQKLQGEKGFLKVLLSLKELGEVYANAGADYFAFSSLCKVGIYETDFGWGNPSWVSPGGIDGSVYQNLVVFMETSDGDGIEVRVTLDEQDMSMLECSTELLSFASSDPNPFEICN